MPNVLAQAIRFNTELVAFEQAASEVRCVVRNVESGSQERISAEYLVAADGVGGRTREELGIGRHGPGELQHWMNLIFETDQQPFLQGRRFTSCFVTDVNGAIVPRDDRWLLSFQYSPERGERPEDFDQARTERLVRQAAGRPDAKVRLFDSRSWDVVGAVSDRFSERRAFLVGDAAHAIPPTGGFGGNTGIHDAHNLAWKLAFVLKRRADPSLLASYDRERRHVAERTLAQALARLAAWFKDLAHRLPPVEPIVDDLAVVFGQLYPNGAVISEGNIAVNEFEDPRHPSGRPGSRAPHIVIDRDDRSVAVHDLFDREFVLLTARDGTAWSDAAMSLREKRSLPLTAIRVASDDFTSKYCVDRKGAVLVRPDGVIAWRAREAETEPFDELVRVVVGLGLTMS